ncbi:MAG: hypothetical protein MK081_12250 [Flavobacteriales bacterium]|nr:hypothetical protein [Flavobacteriales bacterium]
MIRELSVKWFKRKKWRFVGTLPKRLNKVIIVMGPQTGYKDILIGLAVQHLTRFKMRVAIDQKLWKWYSSWLWKRIGGIKVDFRKPEKAKKRLINKINERNRVCIVIPFNTPGKLEPDGNDLFYDVVRKTDSNLVLVALDHRTKTVKFHNPFSLTKFEGRDMAYVRSYFHNYYLHFMDDSK